MKSVLVALSRFVRVLGVGLVALVTTSLGAMAVAPAATVTITSHSPYTYGQDVCFDLETSPPVNGKPLFSLTSLDDTGLAGLPSNVVFSDGRATACLTSHPNVGRYVLSVYSSLSVTITTANVQFAVIDVASSSSSSSSAPPAILTVSGASPYAAGVNTCFDVGVIGNSSATSASLTVLDSNSNLVTPGSVTLTNGSGQACFAKGFDAGSYSLTAVPDTQDTLPAMPYLFSVDPASSSSASSSSSSSSEPLPALTISGKDSIVAGGTACFTLTASSSVTAGLHFALMQDGQDKYSQTAILESGSGWVCIYGVAAGDYTVVATPDGQTPNVQPAMPFALSVVTQQTSFTASGPDAAVTTGEQTTLHGIITFTSPTPGGTITYFDGDTELGSVDSAQFNMIRSDQYDGALATSFATAGVHTITAVYSGDGNWERAQSTFTVNVVDPPVSSSSSSVAVEKGIPDLALSPLDANVGDSTFTVTVSDPSGTGATPSGTVDVYQNDTLLTTLTLVDGVASKQMTLPYDGTFPLNISYSGDANWQHRKASFTITAHAASSSTDVPPPSSELSSSSSEVISSSSEELSSSSSVVDEPELYGYVRMTGESHFAEGGSACFGVAASGDFASYASVELAIFDSQEDQVTSQTVNLTDGEGEACFPKGFSAGTYHIGVLDVDGHGIYFEFSVGDPSSSVTSSSEESSSSSSSSSSSEDLSSSILPPAGPSSTSSSAPSSAPMVQVSMMQLQVAGLTDPSDLIANHVTAFFGPGAVPPQGTLPSLGYASVTPDKASLSTSLSAINAAAGNEQKSPFDVWIDGTFGLLQQGTLRGSYASGHLGMSYLFTPNLLAGTALSLSSVNTVDGKGSADSLSVTLTPFVGGKLSDSLFYDAYAGFGLAQMAVSPDGTYTDAVSGKRWLLGGSLTGQFRSGDWLFAPVLSANYTELATDAYVDGLGTSIASAVQGSGSVSLAPKVAIDFRLEDGTVVTPNAKLAAALGLRNDNGMWTYTGLTDSIGLGVTVATPGGANFTGELGVQGLVFGDLKTLSARVGLNAPIK